MIKKNWALVTCYDGEPDSVCVFTSKQKARKAMKKELSDELWSTLATDCSFDEYDVNQDSKVESLLYVVNDCGYPCELAEDSAFVERADYTCTFTITKAKVEQI